MNVTGSSVGRMMKCPPSASLAQVRRQTQYMSSGTAVHKFLEDVVKTRRVTGALADVPVEHRAVCEAIDVQRLGLTSGQFSAELAMHWARTGECFYLSEVKDRAYSAKLLQSGIPGTYDLVGVNMDARTGYVGDYKTGYDPHGVVEPASEIAQLWLGALILARVNSLRSVTIHVIKIKDDGGLFVDEHIADAFALEMFEARLCDAWDAAARQEAGQKVFSAGSHCWHCPSFSVCPAQTQMLAAVAGGGPIEITQENAGALVERLLQIERLVTTARDQLNALSDQEPIPLGNGKEFGPVEERHLLADNAYGVLVNKFGKTVADAAVKTKTSTSAAAIKKALNDAGLIAYGKASVVMDELLDEMEQFGAVKRIAKHTVHAIKKSASPSQRALSPSPTPEAPSVPASE